MNLFFIIILGLIGFIGIFFLFIFLLQRYFFDFRRAINFTFLQITIPKKESKDDYEKERDQTSEIRKVIAIGEHFFSGLNGLYDSRVRAKFKSQNFVSLEFIATDGEIKFIVGCPFYLKDAVEKQINSYYPEAVIEELESLKIFHENTYQATGYLVATKKYMYPFKTYTKFESADSMNSILNALSNASDENGTSAAIQFMIRPCRNNWQQKTRDFSKQLSSGKQKIAWWNPVYILGKFFSLMVKGTEDENKKSDEGPEKNESQDLIKAMEEKAEKSGFETIIRCVTSSKNPQVAETNLNAVMNAFSQFGAPFMNSFLRKRWHRKKSLIKNFLFRFFRRSWHVQNKMILSTEEIASMFHFPHIKYNNIPSVKWQNYKIIKAPSNIPKEGLLLGHNVYRNEHIPVYMKNEDRFRHFYVIGQTGTGKSSIMQVMARQDLQNNNGMCIVDPHGSLIEDLLPFVPKNRIDDVVIFDPSDLERPMGLNLLEAETEEEKDMVALDSMNLMIKLFDEETFGPRIQDYFRNGVLTLMADPAGGALTDVVRLFTDDIFQRAKVKYVKNPVVKSFWTNQMAKTGAREKQEIIPYFASKFGQFITNGMIRNIIGQTKSAFDFAKVMQDGKILLMNLSKGVTGEINSKLLGLIIVSKLQVAALRRQKIDKEDRRDFFLYID